MLRLMVGNNWDPALLSGILALNEKYANKGICVDDMYGSVVGFNPFGTARPDFRIQKKSMIEINAFIEGALENGIGLSYTVNASFVNTRELSDRKGEIKAFVKLCKSMGLKKMIVAHPLVGEILTEESHGEFEIGLSTILQIRSIDQLKQWNERMNIYKVCNDVFMNRDFPFLLKIKRYCDSRNIRFELIVNEFCVDDCIDRNQCYDLHCVNKTREDTRLFSAYPMGRCMSYRYANPVEWLKARFILPQHLREYKKVLGIDSFKVTGRTHHTSYILFVIEEYLKQDYQGNLLELWAHLENIGKNEEDYKAPSYDIDVSAFPEKFMDFYTYELVERPEVFDKMDERIYLEGVLRSSLRLK